MMQALELLRLGKRQVSGRSNVEKCKIKSIILVVIELHLLMSEPVTLSEPVTQSVENWTTWKIM